MQGEYGDPGLMALSLEELRHILAWFARRGQAGSRPRFVLVGGWAVYCYNPWLRSIDIDLVMNQRTRRGLLSHLRTERGYVRTGPEHLAGRLLQRPTPKGPVRLDIESFERSFRFEGGAGTLELAPLKERVVGRELDGLPVPVPERTMLLVMKLKAAWDRQWRVDNGTSGDADWDRTKALKDLADVLALVDQEMGGADVDVDLLGGYLERFPPLRTALGRVAAEPLAAMRYGIPHAQARRAVERLLMLTAAGD
jgi:hypothetical protein